MDIDNKKVELFNTFIHEIKEELIGLSAHQVSALELAFHVGFEKGYNLGYVTSVEEYEDGKADIPF